MNKLLLALVGMFLALQSFGQTLQVHGRLRSAADGSALPAATIVEKGTSNGTVSQPDGSFKLSVGDHATLEFRALGYLTQDIPVNGRSTINVSMQPDQKMLNSVVVTALGIQKVDRNLGYSVTKISGKDIEQTNTVNPIAALQGKVAGVQVNVVSSGGVQTSPYIQIRGAKVLGGNNQPIFVVDGNILQNNISGPDAADAGSQLKDLNPDDYASITVLKGAAATAIYGSRGINGAIVITTKSGHAQKGIGVEYSTTYSSAQVYKPFMALQNSYGMGTYYREGAFNPDGTQTYTTSNWGPAFDGTMHPAVSDKSKMVPYVAQPGNWKTFYRNGKYLNNNLTLSGGSAKSNYRFSYSHTTDDGILPKNALKRDALDVKVGGQLNRVFSFEMGINYAHTATFNYYNQSRYYWPTGQNLGFDAYYMPRNTDFASWYQNYRNPDNSVKPSNFSFVTNGFSVLDKNNFVNNENSFLGYTQFKAQVNSWLDFSARGNINYLKVFGETKNFGNGAGNVGGYYGVSGNYNSSYDVLLMGHATGSAMNKKLNVDFRLINEYYGSMQAENYNAHTVGGLKVPNEFFLGNSVSDLGTNNGYGYSISYPNTLTVGVGGDLNLNYQGFLNLELTGRNDWLSTLTYPASIPGKNNYSVFYPSVNLMYSFRDEFKSSMPGWLSSGRIRASWAAVGNAGVAGPYSTGSGYSPGSIVDQNGNSVPSATQINGNVKPNYDLKPQISRSLELGTHLGFVHDLVSLDFTYYKTNTRNQLLKIPGVMETGYNQMYINAGNIQNQGIEALLDVNPVNTRDWNLDVSVNLTHNASKILNFYPGITSWQIAGDYEGAQVWAYQGGQFGVLEVRGNTAFQTDPKTGYPIIESTPRSTVTNPNNKVDFANYQYVYDTSNLVNMGKVEPSLTGGFMINLRYKHFSLFSQIDGRLGGMVYSEAWTYAMGNGTPLASLQYRDKAHGGVARVDSYTGQTVYDGAVPNAVFAQGQISPVDKSTPIGGMTFKEAYQKGLVESWYAPAYYDGGFGYAGTYDWENGLNYNGAVSKESWLMLREITVSYSVPQSLLDRIKVVQSARLSLSARNIGYLYNSLPGGQNPASIQSNDPFNPWITGGVPFVRNYSASLDIRF